MFDNTSRTVYEEGLRFYEEDILYDDHIYRGNQTIEIEAEYYQSGLGVLFALNAGASLSNQTVYYLAKIGNKEASIFYVIDGFYKRIGHASLFLNMPCKHLNFQVRYDSGIIRIYVNNQVVLQTELPYKFKEYSLGYYSQKGNTLQLIAIKGKSPHSWRLNMQKTYGGRISFETHGFSLKACKKPAEILQNNIQLQAGTYYLKCKLTGDLKPYLYLATHASFKDTEKNLLQEDLSFTLSRESEVVLKFSGKEGTLHSVQIADEPYTTYVPTYSSPGTQGPSAIYVHTSHLKSFNAIVEVIKINEESIYLKEKREILKELDVDIHIILTGAQKILEPGTYHLNIDCAQKRFVVYQEDEVPILQAFYNYDTLVLFENTSVLFKDILLTPLEGDSFNWPRQTEYKEYIHGFIDTPIIACGKNKAPLDLSASYRIVEDQYWFTNIEREYFPSASHIKLTKEAKQIEGVYGIPKNARADKANIYKGYKENPHDLSQYAKEYQPLEYIFDASNNQVFISATPAYSEIIVDYTKAKSYAINFDTHLKRYEIDLTENVYNLYYETQENPYILTDLKEVGNQYAVIRKGDTY